MDNLNLRRYELAVYLLLVLLAAVLAFLGNYHVSHETVKSIVINLASELLAVGVLFFIVNRLFLLGENNDASTKILDELSTIKNAAILKDSVEIVEKLSSIQGTLGKMDDNISSLTRKIVSEIDAKQSDLLHKIEDRFTTEINRSHSRLHRAIEQELRRSGLAGDQSATVSQLTALFVSVLQTVGQAQIGNVQQEFKRMIEDIATDVNKPVQQLSKDIVDIRLQLQSLPTSLPSSRKS